MVGFCGFDRAEKGWIDGAPFGGAVNISKECQRNPFTLIMCVLVRLGVSRERKKEGGIRLIFKRKKDGKQW